MEDAYGGILNLVFIVVFLLLAIGILGLVVSYTKAFKMKGAVLTAIESYEGSKCTENSSACYKKVVSSAERLGYSPTSLNCPSDYTLVGESKDKGYYCLKTVASEDEKANIYKIIVQIDINLPIINKIMGLTVFQVNGETRPVYKSYD